jgi:N-acetylmuramoyl-L-alanine amidase
MSQFAPVTSPRWTLAALAAVSFSALAADPVAVRIAADTAGASTRVVLTFARPLTCTTSEAVGKLRVVCPEPIVPDSPTRALDDPILTGWATDGDRTLVLNLGGGYRRADTFELSNPARLVLDLQGDRQGGASTGVRAPAASQPVVVLDPGHGGIETGAVGPSGLEEKDVTLDLARRLKPLLERQGLTVVLTRDEDRVMPLDDRTAIANQNRAELFVSLHVNASKRKSAVGAETYFLSTDSTDAEARTLAALENKAYAPPDPAGGSTPATGTPDRGLELILWDLAQNSYLAESSRLAELVQREMNGLAGTKDRGVRQAPFRVLMGATMPAVLVEVSFISNPEEESRLKDGAAKDKIVDAISRAIVAYRRDVASAGTH